MFIGVGWLESDEQARDKCLHQVAVLRRAEFADPLNQTGAQRILEFLAEHHGVGRNRTLGFNASRRTEYFVVEFLRNIAGNDSCFHLTLFERLPTLAVAAAE